MSSAGEKEKSKPLALLGRANPETTPAAGIRPVYKHVRLSGAIQGVGFFFRG